MNPGRVYSLLCRLRHRDPLATSQLRSHLSGVGNPESGWLHCTGFMDEHRLEQDDNPQAGDIPFLSRQVFDYNTAQVGYNDARRLAFFIRDRDDEILGGICGTTYGGWLAVDLLWVREDLRGIGWGKRLLQAAEVEAIARGCRHALLDTMSFQAPGFYEQQGYVVYGVLENFPGEHQRLYYRKRLETGN